MYHLYIHTLLSKRRDQRYQAHPSHEDVTRLISRAPYTFGDHKFCFGCLKRRMDMVIMSSAGYPCILKGTTSTLHPGMFSLALFGDAQRHDLYKGPCSSRMDATVCQPTQQPARFDAWDRCSSRMDART
jgi:hypothetical protein